MKIILLLCGLMMLFSTLVYPMDSSEVIEFEGKIVELGLLLPGEVNPDRYVFPLYNVEILNVFIYPEDIIARILADSIYYVAVKYNNKPFILPCKYIVYIKEVK